MHALDQIFRALVDALVDRAGAGAGGHGSPVHMRSARETGGIPPAASRGLIEVTT